VRAAFGYADGLVFKPGQHRVVGPWPATLFDGLSGPGFRVPQPVRATDGSWIVDGWTAWTTVDGEPDPLPRWPELVAANRAFHRWTVADRVAG
jgi:hypothetical protein